MSIKNFMYSEIAFWIAWILIPIVMEVVPVIFDFFILIGKKIRKRRWRKMPAVSPENLPDVTVIIPVYHSEHSLYRCVKSVALSHYPMEKIEVLLVDNASLENEDASFRVFTECQKDFPRLKMHWMRSRQGKSQALNMALFNSTGNVILHIDSDGQLEQNAIYRIAERFYYDPGVDCLTGTVLTDPEQIGKTRGFWHRLLQKMEFGEYAQAFLAGRNFQSEFNSLFTVSGAFSAFRKSAILKSQLYNFDTVCEDTHVTFQMRDRLKRRVALCSDALFFVDPIEDVDHLNRQRQRWQSGEIEVLHMFKKDHMRLGEGFLKDFVIRLIVYDHTFAFPRMIWYFALIALALIRYPVRMLGISILLLYGLYVFTDLLTYICVLLYLQDFPELEKFYGRKWYLILLLPAFNFLVFWFRLAGILNSTRGTRNWRTRGISEERKAFTNQVQEDFRWLKGKFRRFTGGRTGTLPDTGNQKG